MTEPPPINYNIHQQSYHSEQQKTNRMKRVNSAELVKSIRSQYQQGEFDSPSNKQAGDTTAKQMRNGHISGAPYTSNFLNKLQSDESFEILGHKLPQEDNKNHLLLKNKQYNQSYSNIPLTDVKIYSHNSSGKQMEQLSPIKAHSNIQKGNGFSVLKGLDLNDTDDTAQNSDGKMIKKLLNTNNRNQNGQQDMNGDSQTIQLINEFDMGLDDEDDPEKFFDDNLKGNRQNLNGMVQRTNRSNTDNGFQLNGNQKKNNNRQSGNSLDDSHEHDGDEHQHDHHDHDHDHHNHNHKHHSSDNERNAFGYKEKLDSKENAKHHFLNIKLQSHGGHGHRHKNCIPIPRQGQKDFDLSGLNNLQPNKFLQSQRKESESIMQSQKSFMGFGGRSPNLPTDPNSIYGGLRSSSAKARKLRNDTTVMSIGNNNTSIAQTHNNNNVNSSQISLLNKDSGVNNPYKNIGWVNGILQHYNSEIDLQSVQFSNYVKKKWVIKKLKQKDEIDINLQRYGISTHLYFSFKEEICKMSPLAYQLDLPLPPRPEFNILELLESLYQFVQKVTKYNEINKELSVKDINRKFQTAGQNMMPKEQREPIVPGPLASNNPNSFLPPLYPNQTFSQKRSISMGVLSINDQREGQSVELAFMPNDTSTDRINSSIGNIQKDISLSDIRLMPIFTLRFAEDYDKLLFLTKLGF